MRLTGSLRRYVSDEKPVPKSSSAAVTPNSSSEFKTEDADSYFESRIDSVISISRHWGATRASASALTKVCRIFAFWNWTADTFTATLIFAGQCESASLARRTTQLPIE